jgi:hypothetical protein
LKKGEDHVRHEKMKKRIITVLAVTILIASIITTSSGCAVFQTRKLKSQRARVNSLISVGQDIAQAQDILKANGFKATYENPITPTKDGDYLMQIVSLDVPRTVDDTFFYVLTGGDNPLRRESRHVIIEARTNGIITKLR